MDGHHQQNSSHLPSKQQDQSQPPPQPAPAIVPHADVGNNRLSIPFGLRIPLTVLLAGIGGFSLGAAHGGHLVGLRFRAENAHRLPSSQVGWYLYHKSKNYHVMLGGIKEGARMAGRLGFWAGCFFCIEEAVDRFRGAVVRQVVALRRPRQLDYDELGIERLKDESEAGGVWVQRDFISTVIAALGTAGGFSAWNRLPLVTAARTATMGLKVGLAFGLAQDALSLLRGRRVGYVEWLRRCTGRTAGTE